MSYKDDFKLFINTWIKQNGQNLITGDLLNEALGPWLADRVSWADEDTSGGGFSGKWTFLDSSATTPPSGGFTSDGLDVADISELYVHKNAVGVSFNDTFEKVGGVSVTDGDGNKFIFEVDRTEVDRTEVGSSYVQFKGEVLDGTLTTLVEGEDYTIGFIYGTEEAEVTTIYVITEAEFLAAVTEINTNFVGGSIIQGADITMTQDWTIDLTNIDVYGFNHIISNGGNDIGSDLGYKIITDTGSPTFNNMHFAGSASRSQTIQMSGQDSRELFDFDTSSDFRKITFNDCLFTDIVGGTGTSEVMALTSVPSGGRVEIVFNKCTTNSHNNTVEFDYNGITIGCGTVTGRLLVNVYAQKPSISLTDLSESSLGFQVVSSSGDAPVFNNDGSAYLVAGSNATDEKYLNLDGVPTSDPLQAGVVWNNSGVLTVSAG